MWYNRSMDAAPSLRRRSIAVMIYPLAAGLIALIAIVNLCEMRPPDLWRLVEYEIIQGALWGASAHTLGFIGRRKIAFAIVVTAMDNAVVRLSCSDIVIISCRKMMCVMLCGPSI